jgi:pimeloyl-ACP methyl ester carboxylesterase
LKAKGKHVSMLAHSWAAQMALRYDSQNAQNVDDLILVGAFDVDSLAAWDFPSDREWQGLNDDDWIKSYKGLWSDWSEGTRRFSTEGSSEHDYFSGESLANIRRIGRGQFGQVSCAGGGDHCRWGF